MEKSEIKLEFLGPQGFNPFVAHESSPRSFMFGSHFSQRQPLLTPEKRKIRTGIEHEFKKYVDQIKVDDDMLVHRVINKYPKSIYDDFPFSPETAVLCSRQINDNTIGLELIIIKRHNSFHSKFGYPFKFNIDPSEIKAGVEIKKDTVIAEPYSVMGDGSYAYGVNANTVLMSHYGIPEDGVVVNREFIKKLGFTLYEKRVINLGKRDIPLNLYGDEMNYKPFPYLGEVVKESGLLYSSRTIDENFLPADTNKKALRNVSQLFDKKIFVKPGSIIVDIDIVKNPMSRDTIPAEISKYFNKFSNLKTKYYREIRDSVYTVTKELTEKYANINIVHGFDLHHKLVEAEAFIASMDKKNKVELVDRAVPIDEYKIEITVMTKMYPNYGFKITDIRG